MLAIEPTRGSTKPMSFCVHSRNYTGRKYRTRTVRSHIVSPRESGQMVNPHHTGSLELMTTPSSKIFRVGRLPHLLPFLLNNVL
jgi:hypothetical protein